MNYLKHIYAQKTNPRVLAILLLAAIVLVLSMVDAFGESGHGHKDNHNSQDSMMR